MTSAISTSLLLFVLRLATLSATYLGLQSASGYRRLDRSARRRTCLLAFACALLPIEMISALLIWQAG